MGKGRRRSRSSSSSSSSSSSDSDSGKGKHGKHGKEGKHGKTGGFFGHAMPGAAALAMPAAAGAAFAHGDSSHSSAPSVGHFPNMPSSTPPPYSAENHPGPPPQPMTQNRPPPPPSGYRIPLTTDQPFPDQLQTRYPPFVDSDGHNPIFVGSALMERSVHPCKISPMMQPPVRVGYGGGEVSHHGRYDLLPFDPQTMEWVRTSHGSIPPGRRPVEGGYEEGGQKLYHAVVNINGVMVPGKAGEHLGGASVPYGGGEHSARENYDILCWRF